GVPVQCLPGLSGGAPDPAAAALPGFTVVHLHGGLTPAPYDGWAENIFAPGQDAVAQYPMDQRAALLWYHDHVMGVTRFTVYAGLAGLWIVRDDGERAHVPPGAPARRPARARPDLADRDGRQAAPRAGRGAPGRARAGLRRACRPARRLLRPPPGERAHASQHRPGAVRRDAVPARPCRGGRRPRRAPALPGRHALPGRGRPLTAASRSPSARRRLRVAHG